MKNDELALQLTLKALEKVDIHNVEDAKTIPAEIYTAILNSLNKMPMHV